MPNSEVDGEFGAWGIEAGEVMALREATPEGTRPPYELLERTARFGEAVVRFAKTIPRNPVNDRLIDQLVGAGTSVGANFCEADDAVSGKDFKLRIGICRKEAKETMYFLRMIAAAEEGFAPQAREILARSQTVESDPGGDLEEGMNKVRSFEIRNPKEIRNSKSERGNDFAGNTAAIRISEFGLPSNFGPRISDLPRSDFGTRASFELRASGFGFAPLGFRNSGFLRASGFGFRICPARISEFGLPSNFGPRISDLPRSDLPRSDFGFRASEFGFMAHASGLG